MSARAYFQHYRDNQFNFSSKVLTKYCLSLYTKPFVILSGISGTGKTKIAQLFETFVDEAVAAEPETVAEQHLGFIILNITDGVFNGDGRGNIKFKELGAIFEPEEIPNINERIAELRRQGVSDNITDPETFIIESEWGEFKAGIYLQRAGSPLLRVRFKSKRGEANSFDSQEFIHDHFHAGDILKLEKIGHRRLRIASINDREVRQVEEVMDRRETELISNKLFVSVKSNWTDQSELFGYYNILEEKYNLTPVLRFMLTAQEHPAKPFFLILDEMNLSKVEHYFSDYLSCLESRLIQNGEIKQEKIHLHNYSGYADSNDAYFDVVPESIAIPFNLYVTGTVNIDETTYAFSPKVLDRANVIEFNEVSISNYNAGQADDRFSLSDFPRFGVAEMATAEAFNGAPQRYKDVVNDILGILQPYNLHFGYRVINEMALFIKNSVLHVGNEEIIIADAIDIQIAQKVLPKFSGAFGKLDEPLRKLIAYMSGRLGEWSDVNLEWTKTIRPEDTAYPESISKLIRMYSSFIDQDLSCPVEGSILFEGNPYFLNVKGHDKKLIQRWLDDEYILSSIVNYHPRNEILIIRFDNIVGIVNILGSNFDVRSRKLLDGLSGNEQFSRLLEEINDISRSLTFQYSGTAFSHRESETEYTQNMLEVFDYYYQLVFTYPTVSNLESLLNQCFYRPHSSHRVFEQKVPIWKSKKIAPAFYANLGKQTTWGQIGAEHSLASTPVVKKTYLRTGNYLLPELITNQKHETTFNTTENRFLKFFLQDILSLCLRLMSTKVEKEVKERTVRLQQKILLFLRNPFFKEINRLNFIPGSSSVLLKKSGYKEIYYHFVQSKFSFRPLLEDIRRQAQRPGLKNVATLYEIWVYFKLAAQLFPDKLIRETFKGRVLKNGSSITAYTWEVNNIQLSFNQSYTRKGGGSYSVTLRPDVSLLYNDELFLFDAKYKFNTVVEGEDDLVRLIKAEDVHKMHTYIDAIPAAKSSIALYPGTDYIFYDKLTGRQTSVRPIRQLNGVGALPMLPNREPTELNILLHFLNES
jgi:predicted component of viral defense system (DUF524 family)